MMKVMKKISTFLVCLCMMVCMVPAVAHAADGELRFSDPSTTVGASTIVRLFLFFVDTR